MDIPEEDPKKQDAPKKKAEPSPVKTPEIVAKIEEISLIVANASVGIIQSRSKLNMLSFLLSRCETAEKDRSPEDRATREATEPNVVERFLLDPSESPIKEASEAAKYLQTLQVSVKKIDESDPSNKTLGDFLNDERKGEIQRAAAQLQKEETITDSIKEILLQCSPELLADYNAYEDIIEDLTQDQNIAIILGKNPEEKDVKEMKSLLEEGENSSQSWALLEAEKARLLCKAITLPDSSERKAAAREDCQTLLGSDMLWLVEKQVQHTGLTIQKLYASEQEPSNTPEELFCPEILERMGEEGPNTQQKNAMSSVVEFYLHRRDTSKPTEEELAIQMTRSALASLYVVEQGQWIEHINTLKDYHEIRGSKKRDMDGFIDAHKEEEELPSPGEIPKDPKKAMEARYEKQIKDIETLVGKYNEGVTEDKYRVNASSLIDKLRELGGDTDEGLRSIDENDLKKAGASKILAKNIIDYLGKSAPKKPFFSKQAAVQLMRQHATKLQQKMFSSSYDSVKKELSGEGEVFQNARMLQAAKELGMHSIDQTT